MQEGEAVDGPLLCYRCVCSLAREDYKSSIADVKAAQEAGFGESKDDGTKKTMLLYNLGVAYAGDGKPEEAKKYMQQVISRGDDETLAKAAQDLLDMDEEAEKVANGQSGTH